MLPFLGLQSRGEWAWGKSRGSPLLRAPVRVGRRVATSSPAGPSASRASASSHQAATTPWSEATQESLLLSLSSSIGLRGCYCPLPLPLAHAAAAATATAVAPLGLPSTPTRAPAPWRPRRPNALRCRGGSAARVRVCGEPPSFLFFIFLHFSLLRPVGKAARPAAAAARGHPHWPRLVGAGPLGEPRRAPHCLVLLGPHRQGPGAPPCVAPPHPTRPLSPPTPRAYARTHARMRTSAARS